MNPVIYLLFFVQIVSCLPKRDLPSGMKNGNLGKGYLKPALALNTRSASSVQVVACEELIKRLGVNVNPTAVCEAVYN